MKIGLVLEGGGMRGLYTSGVLDIFLDNNIKIDGIIGVSAGALFGINYCSKQRGRVIRYNKKYIKDKRYMGIKSLIKTGNIINKEFAYYEIPQELDLFDTKEFEKSNIDFYVTITNIKTGKAEYVKVKDVFKETELFRATSSMPFVSRIVEYKNKKYLDGGISDSIPIDKCKELGYDKIIVVLTRPLGYKKKKTKEFLTNLVYKKYPNLIKTIKNRYKNYNKTIDKIIELENKKEIFVIRPSKPLKIGKVEKNPDKLQMVYDLGLKDCNNCIQKLKEYLNN